MKYIITFAAGNGATCTAEAFPYNGASAEESMVSCINYHTVHGYRLVSIATAPLDGSEESDEPDDVPTPEEFVLDDFTDQGWYDAPAPLALDDIAPYWDEFLQDCRCCGRPVPEDLTPELYVTLWNDLYTAQKV